MTEFIRTLIEKSASGLFLPQDSEYVCTSNMVRLIAETAGKKIKPFKFLNDFIKKAPFRIAQKTFANLTYELDARETATNPVRALKEAIQLTET